MKVRINMRIIWVFLAAALFLSMPAYAGEGQGPGGKPGERGEKMMQKMTEDLGLTAEQQAQMKAQRESQKGKMEASFARTKEIKDAMRAELDKAETDAAKVKAYVDQLTDLYRQKLEQRVESVQGMKKILTPEQFSKLVEKMKAKKAEWEKEGKHRRMQGGSHEGPWEKD